MALRGTLKDFGIADIFQLIGHQSKTGVLHVSRRGQDVKIHFLSGNVTHATSSSRQERDMLGSMLVRAEVVTKNQLTEALTEQKDSLRRLGKVLIDKGWVDAETLKEFTRLQVSETIYRLFLWDSGSYEFQIAKVDKDPDIEPIRGENLLMEGFRQADEWPRIRKIIDGYGLRFKRLEDLDELLGDEDEDADLDDAFDFDKPAAPTDPRLTDIGSNERSVFRLATPDRDVQKLIDLSRLGEFETCKALANLVEANILAPSGRSNRPSAKSIVGGIHRSHAQTIISLAIYAVLSAGAGVGIWYVSSHTNIKDVVEQAMRARTDAFQSYAFRRAYSRAHIERLRRAVEVYRARRGVYPDTLDMLVQEGLIAKDDLSFPWNSRYDYRLEGDAYTLVPPLY